MTIITVPPPPDMKASDKLAWIIHAAICAELEIGERVKLVSDNLNRLV
jgi:hypothetical protein